MTTPVHAESSPLITQSMIIFQTPPFDKLATRVAQYVRNFWPNAVVLDETPESELPRDLFANASTALPAYFTIAEDMHTADEIYPKVVTGTIAPTYGLITCRIEETSEFGRSATLVVTSHILDAVIVDTFWRLAGLSTLDPEAFDRLLTWLKQSAA